MEVVNVSVKYIRPQYQNLQEWCKDNVYIGRAGIVFIDGVRYPPKHSIWHNPFKITDGLSRDDAILKYRTYIVEKLGPALIPELEKLRGKKLGCWCKPEKCHGDVILELFNTYII